jgi:hypothetical protein
MTGLQHVLEQRGKVHGDYGDHARVTQALKNITHNFNKVGPASDKPYAAWYYLSDMQRESLDMIAHKIGRILAGNADYRDHWIDIAGYAQLVADRCKSE